LAKYDYDYLHLQLLPQDEVTATKDGLYFKRCFYSSDDERVGQWLLQAKIRKNFKLKCSYDRRLVDSILVYDPKDASAPIECKLVGNSDKYVGYSFDEVEYLERKKDLVNFDGKQESDNARARLDAQTAEISESAVKRRKVAAKGMSRSGRRADTKAAREAERAKLRALDAGLPPPSAAMPSNVIPMPERTPPQSPNLFPVDNPPAATTHPRPTTRDKLRRIVEEKRNAQR
jgi:hypothetical protein